MILFLEQEYIAADLCRRTGCLKSRSTAADYDDIAVLLYLHIFINIALRDSRVHGTANRTVDTDPVTCTADIAGDTFAEQILLTVLYLLYPVRLCDQSAPHADDINISALQNLLYDLRITVIACVDDRLAEFILDCPCHVGSPAIRQIV